jgi:hypothetical protein
MQEHGVVKAVSVSAELTTIQRAIDGAITLVELDRQGGLEDEDNCANVAAILALASCRLRDLGRAGRGSLDVETFWSRYSAADPDDDLEDLVLYPATREGKAKK